MKKILIIEDEKAIARVLSLKLIHEGFEAKIANDGAEGMEILDKESFDLILMDLVMPNKDGFTTMKEINEKKIPTPVVILSNLGQGDDEKKARELGAKGFFIKANTPMAQIVEEVKKMFK
jgi:two-component system, OmpR family, response regulator VicR